jgi:hypothetical protein
MDTPVPEVSDVASARFLTVEEAAEVLNLGRTAAYAAAKRWRETGGAEGMKVIAVGGSLRVPSPWLEEMAGGPIDLDELRAGRARRKAVVREAPAEPEVASPPVLEVHTNPDPTPSARSSRRHASAPAPQLDLFEPSAAS